MWVKFYIKGKKSYLTSLIMEKNKNISMTAYAMDYFNVLSLLGTTQVESKALIPSDALA